MYRLYPLLVDVKTYLRLSCLPYRLCRSKYTFCTFFEPFLILHFHWFICRGQRIFIRFFFSLRFLWAEISVRNFWQKFRLCQKILTDSFGCGSLLKVNPRTSSWNYSWKYVLFAREILWKPSKQLGLTNVQIVHLIFWFISQGLDDFWWLLNTWQKRAKNAFLCSGWMCALELYFNFEIKNNEYFPALINASSLRFDG